MAFTYDANGDLIQSRIFLANPQKNYIGELSSVKDFSIADNFNNMNEISFVVYEFENDEYTDYYDKIENKRLIEIQYLGWFQITEVNKKQDENSQYEYKTVSCLSLENELVDKNIDDINGVYGLYDTSNTDNSLLHIVAKLTNWKIGHVDNSLLLKKRTFDIDTAKIYNFLTTDVSKSLECVFIFDTYAKTINVYELSSVGELTDIVVSGRNIIKNYDKVSKGEDIVTKIKVLGADGVDIRNINPTATNYLINVDYFLNTDWMSQGLVDAYTSYQTSYTNYLTTYNSLRNTLKLQLHELATLDAQLVNLEGLKKAQEEVQGSYIQLYSGTPPIGTPEYTSYLNATNNITSYVTQISLKKAEIKVKESQIATTKTSLANIGISLNISNYFSSAQLDELSSFLTEGDTYEDSNFVVTDSMTDEEALDMELELMQNGANELARASQPQFTTTIGASNLFTIRDDADSPITYAEWRNKFQVGNLITIKFREDYWITARLIKMEIDFNNPSDIQLTFSDKNRFDDGLTELSSIIALAGRTSSALSLAKFGYDQASATNSDVRQFMNNTLDATLNAMQNNENQELFIDTYGLHMRKWLPDQNKYSDYQSWWNTNNLMFSSDGFKTSRAGIGLFTNPSSETFYGVIADVIVGNFMLTSALTISNQNNTITMNKDGATFTNCDITITKGTSILKLNAADGIKLTNSGVSQFYIDGSGNATFAGQITGGSININNRFLVSSNGDVTLPTNATISWGQVTSQPTILSGAQVTQITRDTVTTSYVNALNVTANEVRSGWVYTGGINASQIIAGSISADRITGGTMNSVNINSSGTAKFAEITLQGTSTSTWIAGGQLENSYITTSFLTVLENINTPTINYKTPSYSGHTHSSLDINPSLTSSSNINFPGGTNGASVTWCNATFQTLSASDFRLKKNISSLDILPDQLFMSIKPKQFEFKTNTYGKGIHFGVLSQELESAFASFGLDPMNYNICELSDVMSYNEDGLYVDDKIHRINYNNLISWTINIVQKQQLRIEKLESLILGI